MSHDVTVEEYRKALLECGVAVEIQSPEHMVALCRAVLSNPKSSTVARCVVEHGQFVATEKLQNGRVVERHLLVVPPGRDDIRSVVSALTPLPFRCDTASYAALAILQALRPSGGVEKIVVPVERVRLDSVNGVRGDIAAAYSAHVLGQCRADKKGRLPAPQVPIVEVGPHRWVVLSGEQQKKGGDIYAWDAAMVVPKQPTDADEWHFYYGRPITIRKGERAFIGRRVKFVAGRKARSRR